MSDRAKLWAVLAAGLVVVSADVTAKPTAYQQLMDYCKNVTDAHPVRKLNKDQSRLREDPEWQTTSVVLKMSLPWPIKPQRFR